MDLRYEIINGSYCLVDGDEDPNCITNERDILFMTDKVAIAFDLETGTLHKHGSLEIVNQSAEDAREIYRQVGLEDMSNDIIVMSGDFPVEEINKCISTSGYCKRLYEKLSKMEPANKAIDSEIRMAPGVEMSDDRVNSPAVKFDWSYRTKQPILDLPFVEGPPSPQKAKAMTAWVKDNSDPYENKLVKFYHGAGVGVAIEEEGLKPTSSTRRRSYQSASGFVYLANTPERAEVFGKMANMGQCVVYEVAVLIRNLLPDRDQLDNKRSVGEDVGNSIGESILYGGGVRVKGHIDAWQVRKMSETELNQSVAGIDRFTPSEDNSLSSRDNGNCP